MAKPYRTPYGKGPDRIEGRGKPVRQMLASGGNLSLAQRSAMHRNLDRKPLAQRPGDAGAD